MIRSVPMEARGRGLPLRGRKVVEVVATDRLFHGDSIRVRRMTWRFYTSREAGPGVVRLLRVVFFAHPQPEPRGRLLYLVVGHTRGRQWAPQVRGRRASERPPTRGRPGLHAFNSQSKRGPRRGPTHRFRAMHALSDPNPSFLSGMFEVTVLFVFVLVAATGGRRLSSTQTPCLRSLS
ncbi:hypothetical protein GW17_00049893 [Ensete ventricosum]|nr:hypothetical protein GW17_00049893 [Ensete ventricosum]